jgi:hypothetical protein
MLIKTGYVLTLSSLLIVGWTDASKPPADDKEVSESGNTVLSAVSNTSPMSCLTIPDLSLLDGCTLYTPDPEFDPTAKDAPPFQIMTGDGKYVLQASMKVDQMPFLLVEPDDPISNPFLQIFHYNPAEKSVHLAIDSTFVLSLTLEATLKLIQRPLFQRDLIGRAKASISKGDQLTPCQLAEEIVPVITPIPVPPIVLFASINGTLIASLEEDASLAYDSTYEIVTMPYRSCVCKGLVLGGQLWQLAPVLCDVEEKSVCKCKSEQPLLKQ